MFAPGAARWLCLATILLLQGVGGQLSLGDADSFMPDDLTTPAAHPAHTTPAQDGAEGDDVTPGDVDYYDATTLAALADDFGEKVSDNDSHDGVTRPPDAPRHLDDDWHPNWPSHLLPHTPHLAATPVLRGAEGPPTGDVEPSLTVAKVPVTQYFFDVSSAVPDGFSGPLHRPEDVFQTASPTAGLPDLRPSLELVSGLLDLQSSILAEEFISRTVTPVLPGSSAPLPHTAGVAPAVNVLAASPTLRVVVTPTPAVALGETEKVDNTLGEVEALDTTSLVSEASGDDTGSVESTGPRPHTGHDLDDDLASLSTSSEPQPDDAVTNSVALNPEDDLPGSTGDPQVNPALLDLTAPQPSDAAVVSTPVEAAVSSRPPQLAEASRIPLWMLLNKPTPSHSVNTQPMLSSTPASSFEPDIQPTSLPASVLASDSVSDVLLATQPASDSVLLESSLASFDSASPSATLTLDPSMTSLLDKTRSDLDSLTPSNTIALESSLDSTTIESTLDLDNPSTLDLDNPSTLDLDNPSTPESPVKPTDDSNVDSDSLLVSASVDASPTPGPTVVPAVAPVDIETWTPVGEETEAIRTTAVTSQTVADTSQTVTAIDPSAFAPELTGGFTPIVSTSSDASIVDNASSEPLPTNTDLVLSFTTDPVESVSVSATHSTVIPDSVSVILDDKASTYIDSSLEEPIVSSVPTKEQFLPTEAITDKPFIRHDPTSLDPSFDISATPTPSTPSVTPELTIPFSDTSSPTLSFPSVAVLVSSDVEQPVISSTINSDLPSITNTDLPFTATNTDLPFSATNTDLPFSATNTDLPLPATNTDLPFLATTNTIQPSATSVTPIDSPALLPSLTTSAPETHTTIVPDQPKTTPPAPSSAVSTDPPTLTGPSGEAETTSPLPTGGDLPVVPGDETYSEDTHTKEEEVDSESITTPEPEETPKPEAPTTQSTQPTRPTTPHVTAFKEPTPTEPTPTEPAPTEPATMLPEPTATPEPTSAPDAPSTPASPTESSPTQTDVTNGTAVSRPLAYVRALVSYSGEEFCRHRRNFRTLLAQWISSHMPDVSDVSPHEVVFFNMPECTTQDQPTDPEMGRPLEPEDFGHDTGPHFGSPTDPDYDLLHPTEPDFGTPVYPDHENETNVYFYITRAGRIDPYLTEQFPLIPTELEISEELAYLKAKVMQLEIVRPGGAELPLEEEAALGTSIIVIIVVSTLVGVTMIFALVFFVVLRKRGASNNYYGRRCTPVSMDAYSMDSVSVYHSFRRKSKRRASGRSIKSYLNQAFDDPNGPSRPLNFAKLTHFISDIDGVHEEFQTIPVNMPKYDELPSGVDDKNRYANVIPVPETRVTLKVSKDPVAEYVNANYVRGARNESKYYIATQAPLDNTVADFWRMVWEQESRVVVMLTDFVEKGIDKCADYLPPSETLDCHRVYGEFQVTLKSRDMKEKFVVSNVQIKNLENNLTREVAHMWFTGWPPTGVPNEESSFISFILEVRRNRKKLRAKGPVVVHCSPGTGRTGAFIACDVVMKQFEDQRTVDVARTVYGIRRDRAGAVQTKGQYAFIYRVINLYASKLTTGNLDSL